MLRMRFGIVHLKESVGGEGKEGCKKASCVRGRVCVWVYVCDDQEPSTCERASK